MLQVQNSITKTIARAMVVILLLSVTTTSITVVSLYSNLNDAEAINVSGSLRMQSYRLAFDIETGSDMLFLHLFTYEKSLHSPALKEIDQWFTPRSLVENYHQLLDRWEYLQPKLQSDQENNKRYLDQVAQFVNEIDTFVYSLQEFAQFKLRLLSYAYALGFGLILCVALYVIYYSQTKIVGPLKRLMFASTEVESGNFNIQLPTRSANELGVLATAFNSMASELEKDYLELEYKVAEKTHRLEHAKDSLELLYGCQKELSVTQLVEQNFTNILTMLLETEGIVAVNMVVQDSDLEWEIRLGEPSSDQWHIEPLKLDNEQMGRLEWQYTLPCPDQALISNVAQILSRGLYYSNVQKQSEQLLLMEERATIARELHDSIAQSLSYLKIQTTLLNRSLDKSNLEVAIEKATEIDKQLSATYTQLRELLSTFRLTIEKANLGEALVELLNPLREQTSAKIVLDNKLVSISLRANHQVHVIQLIREAVLNAIRHGKPSEIKVLCQQADNMVDVKIIDDGEGFYTDTEKLDHYGLTIMSERAERLNGQLSVSSEPGEGCCVQLLFPLQA